MGKEVGSVCSTGACHYSSAAIPALWLLPTTCEAGSGSGSSDCHSSSANGLTATGWPRICKTRLTAVAALFTVMAEGKLLSGS